MVTNINITSVRQLPPNCSIGISSFVLYIQCIKICFGILKRTFFIILRCSACGFGTRCRAIDNAVKASLGCLNWGSSFGDFTRAIRVAIERRFAAAGFLSACRWLFAFAFRTRRGLGLLLLLLILRQPERVSGCLRETWNAWAASAHPTLATWFKFGQKERIF